MATKTPKKNIWTRRFWILAFVPLTMIVFVIIIGMASGLPDVDALANPKINLATQIIAPYGKSIGA